MVQIIVRIITAILTSFYLFPFKFTFLPSINTKMMMSAAGVVFCILDLIRRRDQQIRRNLFVLFITAGIFSIICLAAVVYNGTNDYEYVTYIASMTLWLSGAYGVCSIIKLTHKRIDVKLTCNYFISVCLCQCIFAILIDNFTAVQIAVDMFVIQGAPYFREIGRLYGIGAALDVAGTRFAACIVVILYFLSSRKESLSSREIWFYILSLITIFVIGNMVARTTTIGMIIGLAWCVAQYCFTKLLSKEPIGRNTVLERLLVVIIFTVPFAIHMYNSNERIHKQFRFAFEGFFSLFEYGRWQVDSNDKLSTMVVFPDNAKTWIIGDGYISNPGNKDLNFIGDITSGNYYMATDIGYLRFIFYCGIIGLIAFVAFMAYSCNVCCEEDSENRWLFITVLFVNYAIWFKVATDIFLLFALFICTCYLSETSETDLTEYK